MFDNLEVQVLYPARWWRRISEVQGQLMEQVCGRENLQRALARGKRKFGIPCVLDHFVQQAMLQVKHRHGIDWRRQLLKRLPTRIISL